MYRSDIDLLKGIAIIAVIFYHIGILPFGFLGVDTFLAVNGFLIIPPLVRKIHENQFNYFEFLTRRISRLWPIVVAASAVCLLLGCWLMLPGAYEDLSESVIASNFFLQNILSSITTDYWDSATEYKPLMQMWYLGVIVQFYLIIPLIFMAFNKCFSKFFKGIVFWNYIILLLFLSSLAIYLFYPDSFNHKFYFVQYRIWEFMLGGFLGLNIGNFKIKYNLIQYGGIVLLCLIFGFGFKTLSDIDEVTIIGAGTEPAGELLKMILTVITVCITAMIMLKNVKWGGCICYIGKMSLSLFVWHQVILAYLRYSFIERFDWFSLVLFLFATTIISFISYRTIEKINHKTWLQKAFTSSLLLITTLSALAIYRNAGVVRDVPEFGISKENPFANRNTVYIDSIYQLQKPFETNRIHALIVGNSFARDFASILKEYDVNNDIEISYSPNWNDINKNILSMTEYLFVFGAKHSIPDYIFKEVPKSCKIYGISTKCYGKNFGIFYSKRNTPDYFNLNIPSNSSCDSINKSWEYEWGKDHFINIMDASRLPNGNIRIFTPENKAISFDCRHLTRFGCKYLSNRLNLQSIFKNKNDD